MLLTSSTVFVAPLFFVLNIVTAYPLSDDEDSAPVDLSYLGARAFSQPDPKVGKRLEEWNSTSEMNPEELGEYAEGDIVFPSRARNGMVAQSFRWKNGVIPYEIVGRFPAKELDIIQRAMGIYKKVHVHYSDNTGCWSNVGRIKGKQQVNLQSPSCTTKIGTTLHELMHAAGFLHEQNRYERDDYVSITWQNIKKGHEANFDKADKGTTDGFGVPYDYRSVMHYSSKAFSSNGQPTIVPKDASKVEKMGQRDGFSKGDITKINAMYKCPEKTLEVTKGNVTESETQVANASTEKETPSNPLVDAATGLLSFFFN
ncbi:hypothetical protein NQ318_015073 [Aromia moschata]|uniref:Metalloendopeptidase n=1 Tax=Aromia moschata TaxID=1265417 RepID=A0AAV8YZX5_9CUCU|nr:hypothetical protein NQ318_015073 [Aromia moschata]